MPSWGSIEINTCFSRSAYSEICWHINQLAVPKKVAGHLFGQERLVVLVSIFPWGSLNQACSKQTSSTGSLGSTPARMQLVVGSKQLFNKSSSTIRVSKDQPCSDNLFAF